MLREAFRRGWPEVQPLVPKRVRAEVERYLRCGDVRYGFVEVACQGCEVPRLVALRCRGRGWCPSCTTRRALETGLQLEAELPRVRHRQWTLSMPKAARFQVVKQPGLLKRLEVRLVQAVWRHLRATARRLGAKGTLRGGAVCFWQYFGSSLQLTPHLHLLVPEALWTEEGEVVTLPPPDDAQVTALLARVLRQARRDWAAAEAAWAEDDYEGLRAEALQRPLGLELPASPHRRRRVGVLEGFSLHADTAVQGQAGGRPLPVHAQEGRGLHRHRDGPGEAAGGLAASAQQTPHQLPRRVRPQRPPSPHRHDAPTAHGPATSDAAGDVSPEAAAQAHRLGHAAPPHLRHGRPAMSLRWASHRHRPPLHPQGRRGAPRRAGPALPLAAAPAADGSASARARGVAPGVPSARARLAGHPCVCPHAAAPPRVPRPAPHDSSPTLTPTDFATSLACPLGFTRVVSLVRLSAPREMTSSSWARRSTSARSQNDHRD